MLRKTMILFGMLLLVGGAALPLRQADPVSAATIRYVATDGVDTGACDSVAARCRTLQYAVDAADPGDTLHVAGGLYAPGGTVATITQPVHIIGAYDPAFAGPDSDMYETVLDAGWNGSVVHIHNAGSVTLEHLTLTHGDGSGNCSSNTGCGGGVYARDSELFIRHCRILENVGNSTGSEEGQGGGIYARPGDGEVQILSSEMLSNTANTSTSAASYSRGGALFLRGGTALVSENDMQHNAASAAGTGGQGGAAYLYVVGKAEILHNRFENNSAATLLTSAGSGGALYVYASTADVIGNWIEGNWTNPNMAGSGGGIYALASILRVERNTILGNVTRPADSGWGTEGGGIYIALSPAMTLTNNLIALNRAYAGGGVYVAGTPTEPTAALLVNNTLADNDGGGIGVGQETVLTLTNNIIAGHSLGVDSPYPATSSVIAATNLFWNISDPLVGTNALLNDPLLAPGYRLGHGSPAIDAGLTIPWLTLDLVGASRPQGSGYDLGAFETRRDRLFLPLAQSNRSGP